MALGNPQTVPEKGPVQITALKNRIASVLRQNSPQIRPWGWKAA
jgi:hypothetical protein